MVVSHNSLLEFVVSLPKHLAAQGGIFVAVPSPPLPHHLTISLASPIFSPLMTPPLNSWS